MNSDIHNRFKLRFFVLCLVCGGVMVVGGLSVGPPGLVIPGALVLAASVPPIWVIMRRRSNPWWLRSRFDSPPRGDVDAARSTGSATPERTRIRGQDTIALLGSAAFVVTGVVLIAIGIGDGRAEFVLVGALSVLFFGGGGALVLAMTRESD